MDRRSFVRGVAGGVALAGGQLLLPRSILAAGLPSGALESEELYALPGKQPLIKRSFRPPNFETPVALFQRTSSRRTTASSSATTLPRYPEVDPRDLAARDRRRRGLDSHSSSPSSSCSATSSRSRSWPSASAPATGAACPSRTCPACSGAMAQWAMRAGRACGSRTCSPRPASGRRRVEVAFDGADTRRTRQDARFRQEHPGLEGDGREHAGRLGDERRAAAALERLSRAHRRARLDRRPTG